MAGEEAWLERCLPAWARRREAAGREVRRLRRVLRLSTEMSTGTVMGIAGGARLVSEQADGRREAYWHR